MSNTSPDPLAVAESLYGAAVAAQATLTGVTFASLATSDALEATTTSPTTRTTVINPQGWNTATGPVNPAYTYTTVTALEGNQAQTLAAPLASIQSANAIAASTAGASSTSSGLSNAANLGLGIGLGVGLPVVLAAMATYMFMARRREKREFAQRTQGLRQMAEAA